MCGNTGENEMSGYDYLPSFLFLITGIMQLYLAIEGQYVFFISGSLMLIASFCLYIGKKTKKRMIDYE